MSLGFKRLKCGVNISCKVSTMSWGRTAKRSKEDSCAAVILLELFKYRGHAVFILNALPVMQLVILLTGVVGSCVVHLLTPPPEVLLYLVEIYEEYFCSNRMANVWFNVLHIEWQPFPKFSSQYHAKIHVLNISTQTYTMLHTTVFQVSLIRNVKMGRQKQIMTSYHKHTFMCPI